MKEFTIFWLDGTTEKVAGVSEKDAFTSAGYGNGAVSAVDFISNKANAEKDYVWNKEKRSWERIIPIE